MPKLVVTGAVLSCSMGTTPCSFIGGCKRTTVQHKPAGTIMDHRPVANVPPFGMCRSLANPSVASATAAAQGSLTPMPCMPNLPGPWAAGSATVKLEHKPALRQSDKLSCAYAGVISVKNPGQTRVDVK